MLILAIFKNCWFKNKANAHVIDRLWPLFTFFCIITKRSSEIENTAEKIDLFTQCEKIFQIMIWNWIEGEVIKWGLTLIPYWRRGSWESYYTILHLQRTWCFPKWIYPLRENQYFPPNAIHWKQFLAVHLCQKWRLHGLGTLWKSWYSSAGDSCTIFLSAWLENEHHLSKMAQIYLPHLSLFATLRQHTWLRCCTSRGKCDIGRSPE